MWSLDDCLVLAVVVRLPRPLDLFVGQGNTMSDYQSVVGATVRVLRREADEAEREGRLGVMVSVEMLRELADQLVWEISSAPKPKNTQAAQSE